MSKGISDLHKAILTMAYKEIKKQRRKRKDSKYMPPWKVETHHETRSWTDGEPTPEFATTTHSYATLEGMMKVGWIPTDRILIEVYGWKRNPENGGLFSKHDIGAKKYMSVKIALKKSLARLEKRDLIVRGYGGDLFTLTPAGIDLMAKK